MKRYGGFSLAEIGVISGADMTCEAAVSKLAYLLGRGLNQKQVELGFAKNIRGEMQTEVSQKTNHDLVRECVGFRSKL
jgi:hypothetical protein